MKYITYYLVDPITQCVIHPTWPAPNGRTHPSLPELDVKIQLTDANNWETVFATCSDTAEISQDSGIIEHTHQEIVSLIETHFDLIKQNLIKTVYQHAQTLRQDVLDGWYHSSEIAMGIAEKYKQAILALDAETDELADAAAPLLHSEATFRNIATKALAQKVVDSYEHTVSLEARLAGIRGRKVDQLLAITFDSTSFDTALDSIQSLWMVDIFGGWD
jgi:hypothetical protein